MYYNLDMQNTHTIFNPIDNSLKAKIKAYQSVVKAWYNSEASIKAMETDEWAYTLGEKKEVVKANDIIASSLQEATKKISEKDIQKAREQGFLTESEAREFTQNKRYEDIQKIRKNRQKTKRKFKSRQR